MKKIIAALVVLGTLAATPANAWYRGVGGWSYGYGYGYGGYGAALGIGAGAALLGGVIGGAIANQNRYGYGYAPVYNYAPQYAYPPYNTCYLARVPYYDAYGVFVGYRSQTVC